MCKYDDDKKEEGGGRNEEKYKKRKKKKSLVCAWCHGEKYLHEFYLGRK